MDNRSENELLKRIHLLGMDYRAKIHNIPLLKILFN
jgi:hypothetical protein